MCVCIYIYIYIYIYMCVCVCVCVGEVNYEHDGTVKLTLGKVLSIIGWIE